MSTREQDLQALNGVASLKVGTKHLEFLKQRIAALKNQQKEVQESLKQLPKKEQTGSVQEQSFVIKHAPIIGVVVAVFVVLQFFGFTILGAAGIIGLIIAVVVAVAVGFLAGVFAKKNAISKQKSAVLQKQEQAKKEKENCKKKLRELEEELSVLQNEVKATRDEVDLLRKTYLSDTKLNSFCKTHGEGAVDVLLLYFQRGRADSIEEAVEIYEDEAKDKARILQAQEEIERSSLAYINAYVDALNTLGRSREYSYLEASLENYNADLEKENKDLRELMDR